jgi:hypothetical protein
VFVISREASALKKINVSAISREAPAIKKKKKKKGKLNVSQCLTG